MWRICSFRRGKWEKTAEETTSFPDIKGLERKVPWDGREANSRTEKKRTHIAVTAILSSPSGLADAREQLKAMTRKAQHTPETLDSLGMIISPSPPSRPVPSLRPLAAVSAANRAETKSPIEGPTGRRLRGEVAADSLFKQGCGGADAGQRGKERRRNTKRPRPGLRERRPDKKPRPPRPDTPST